MRILSVCKKLGSALCWLLPAAVALLLYLLLPLLPASFTETVFSRGLFPVLSAVLGWPLSFLPFSLTELCAVAAIPAAIGVLVWRIVRRVRKAGKDRFWRGVGWVASSLLLVYMLLHGVNFYRLSASELMELDTSPKNAEQLKAVCIYLADTASAARAELSEDENGVAMLSSSIRETLVRGGEGYALLAESYDFLGGSIQRTKPVMLSHLWSYTGITGMYFPLLAETNINVDVPSFTIPATVMHELAHTRGFAREDECNFFAYLACMEHPSADFRYSGAVLAYIHCSNALYDYDVEMWEEVFSHCSDGMVRDLRAQNAYWDNFKGEVKEISSSVNDTFLQIQGEEDGVLSYSRVVELLLAYCEKAAPAS